LTVYFISTRQVFTEPRMAPTGSRPARKAIFLKANWESSASISRHFVVPHWLV